MWLPFRLGFEQYLVYLSEPGPGAFEPTTYEEFLAYQADVFVRGADEVAALREEAIAFHASRFGLDFSGAAPDAEGVQTIPGVATHSPSFVRPERNYQAHTVGGESVPPSGWDVRDASFNVTLTDDVVLHGTYGGEDGKAAQAGALLAFGHYSIAVDRAGTSEGAAGRSDEIRIRFTSSSPIVANADGGRTFVCNLEHAAWGTGQARGIVTPDGGIRNVLTFRSSIG